MRFPNNSNRFNKMLSRRRPFHLRWSGVALAAAIGTPSVWATGLTRSWANSGEDKVTQDELRASSGQKVTNAVWDGRAVSIWGLRNETVAFNVILEAAAADAPNLHVDFSKLIGATGTLGSTAVRGNGIFDWTQRPIEVFLVRYLPIKGLSKLSYETYDERHVPARMRRTRGGDWTSRPDHNRQYPDIAVPIELAPTFLIRARSNQSVWVDVYVPKDTSPGIYAGVFRVRQGDAVVSEMPVRLTVRKGTLPESPSAKTMLAYSSENILRRYLGMSDTPASGAVAEKAALLRDRHYQLAHRHRFSLIGDTPGDCGSPLTDHPCPESARRLDGSLFTAAHSYGGPGVNVGNNVYAIGIYGTWPWRTGGEAAMRQHTDAWAEWFSAHAPTTETFLYLIDESSDTARIEQWARWMANNPGPGGRMRSMATLSLVKANAETPTLDIPTSTLGLGETQQWEALAQRYSRDDRKRFFLYNGNRPGSGSTAIEDDGVSLRARAWAQFKKHVQRWFYWETTYYNNYQGGMGETDVFESAHTFGKRSSVDPVSGESGWNYSNGDGVLFYPGTDRVFPKNSYGVDGPFASLRLKHWRRGLQDVDYLTMAAKLDPAAVQRIVQETVPKVLWEYGVDSPRDPTYVHADISWSSDPDVWDAARAQLAAIIDRAP